MLLKTAVLALAALNVALAAETVRGRSEANGCVNSQRARIKIGDKGEKGDIGMPGPPGPPGPPGAPCTPCDKGRSGPPVLRWEALRKGQAIPTNALRGGYIATQEISYVARVWHDNAIVPCHVHSEGIGGAFANWNGTAVHKSDGIEVLLDEGERLLWVPASHGKVPEGAVEAGVASDGGPLYSCRVLVRAENRCSLELQPGVLRPSFGTCDTMSCVPVSRTTYEVLVLDPRGVKANESSNG